jgi:hypothetical protein
VLAEMAEVIGGKFWKPHARMSANPAPPTEIAVGRDPKQGVSVVRRRIKTAPCALSAGEARLRYASDI